MAELFLQIRFCVCKVLQTFSVLSCRAGETFSLQRCVSKFRPKQLCPSPSEFPHFTDPSSKRTLAHSTFPRGNSAPNATLLAVTRAAQHLRVPASLTSASRPRASRDLTALRRCPCRCVVVLAVRAGGSGCGGGPPLRQRPRPGRKRSAGVLHRGLGGGRNIQHHEQRAGVRRRAEQGGCNVVVSRNAVRCWRTQCVRQ